MRDKGTNSRPKDRRNPNFSVATATGNGQSSGGISSNQLSDAKREFEHGKNTITSFGKNIDKHLNSAASTIKRGNDGYNNPTASGSGSIKSDREWEDHKYIDKVKTKSGNIRYIYDGLGGGTSTQSKQARDINTKKNMIMSQRQAPSRNTGGGDKEHSLAAETSRAINRTARDITRSAAKTGKALSDGADAVGGFLSDMGGTAMSALDNILKR